MFGQFLGRVVGQHLAGAEIAVAAVIKVGKGQVEIIFASRRLQDLDPFGNHLGSGAVTPHHRDIICLCH